MKRKKVKFFAMVLAAVMAGGLLLPGCSGGDGPGEKPRLKLCSISRKLPRILIR